MLLLDRGGERTFHVVGTLPSIDFEIVKMELGNVTNCTFLLKTFMNMLDTLVRENLRLQRVSRNESFFSMCVVFMSVSSWKDVGFSIRVTTCWQ